MLQSGPGPYVKDRDMPFDNECITRRKKIVCKILSFCIASTIYYISLQNVDHFTKTLKPIVLYTGVPLTCYQKVGNHICLLLCPLSIYYFAGTQESKYKHIRAPWERSQNQQKSKRLHHSDWQEIK